MIIYKCDTCSKETQDENELLEFKSEITGFNRTDKNIIGRLIDKKDICEECAIKAGHIPEDFLYT
jgi:hypothetical protein